MIKMNGGPRVVVEGEEVVAQAEEEAAFLGIEETGTTWNAKKTLWPLHKVMGDEEEEGEEGVEAEVEVVVEGVRTSECAWTVVKEQEEEVTTTTISSTITTKAMARATIIMEAMTTDTVAITLLHPITTAADFAVVEEEEWDAVGEEVEVVVAVEVLLLLVQLVKIQTQQALLRQMVGGMLLKAVAETKSELVAARVLASPVAVI